MIGFFPPFPQFTTTEGATLALLEEHTTMAKPYVLDPSGLSNSPGPCDRCGRVRSLAFVSEEIQRVDTIQPAVAPNPDAPDVKTKEIKRPAVYQGIPIMRHKGFCDDGSPACCKAVLIAAGTIDAGPPPPPPPPVSVFPKDGDPTFPPEAFDPNATPKNPPGV